MKKTIFKTILLCLMIGLLFSGCSSNVAAGTGVQASGETTSETNGTTQTQAVEAEEVTVKVEAKGTEMNRVDFEALLSQLPVAVVSTKYVVQDKEYKSIYPDMLQTIILNQTEEDIKDAVVAIVAWDENKLPVKLKGNIDFSDGSYVKEVEYSDINLIGGATFGEDSGFGIDQAIQVTSFKAIPVRMTNFDGDTWENPYFDEWKQLYEGKKYSESMTVEVVVDPAQHVMQKAQGDMSSTGDADVLESDLNSQIEKQLLKVVESKVKVQDTQYKSIYPDLLQAILKNDTDLDIKNAVVAFVAWDENRLPVPIKGNMDFTDGSYVKLVDYNDINLVPGKSYGQDSGYGLDEYHRIKSFKAMVVSYESFDGTTWENPLFDDWIALYEGKKMK